MNDDFTPEQKKVIGSYAQWLLRCNGITQKKIAVAHGCSESAVSHALHQGQLHEAMPRLKNYIAERGGRTNWAELCAEALAQADFRKESHRPLSVIDRQSIEAGIRAGWTARAIAESTGCSRTTVQKIKRTMDVEV